MAALKLTKSELRSQQQKLNQLQKYLPTLQLKKALLQTEVNEAKSEILKLESAYHQTHLTVSEVSSLFTEKFGLDLTASAKVEKIVKHYENIAGVNIPIFEKVEFAPFEYLLFGSPAWVDSGIELLRKMSIAKAKLLIAQEKKSALEKELREVTIRVNLFEKNLIPKSKQNIKKIKVFLGDQQLAAISQAKVAKNKIEEAKRRKRGASPL